MSPLIFLPVLLNQNQLQIDPLLIVQATETWSVIGAKENQVWPGWNARQTPILIYFPNKQDVLINHPRPPQGFRRYEGPIQSPIGPIFVKDGATLKTLDGQNTSTTVNGIGTLVVADTLSTRRQWAESMAESRNAAKAITDSLFPNPIDSMCLFAHEAFHVYQTKLAPNKQANEMHVLNYPQLSVDNNVGVALESEFLAEVANASGPAIRRAAIKWLAARRLRRSSLPADSVAYEDGNEFMEGLAKYVEYRFTECLEGRRPSKEMWLVQGFQGYNDLASQRQRLLKRMISAMSGEMNINNDPFGASPVRFRLYFSGMGIAILLDKLGARWHKPVLATDVSLAKLAEDMIKASPQELESAQKEILASTRYKELRLVKQKLLADGTSHVKKVLSDFDASPGELVIDYSGLSKPSVGFGFTPFGVLRIDEDQAIFRLIPVSGQIGSTNISEDGARPVFYDKKAKIVRYQLSAPPDEPSIRKQSGAKLDLPGVTIQGFKGAIEVQGKRVTLRLTD